MSLATASKRDMIAGVSDPQLVDAHARSTPPMHSVARGALALLSTQPLTWATSMLAVVLVPRYLGAVAFGQSTLGVNLATFVGPMCTLGLLDYLTRNLSGRPRNELQEATQAWVLMSLTACIGAVGLAVGVTLLGIQLGSPLVLAAALGNVLVIPTQGLLLTILRGHERMGLFAAVNSIGAAAASLVPIAVLIGGGGLGAFALSTFLVNLVAMVVGWWKSGVRLPRVHISPSVLLRLIPLGLPFLGWTLTMQFYGQINGLLLGILAPSEVVGWYSAANRIISVPVFVPVLIATPLLPALTRCRSNPDVFRHTLNTSLRATLLVTLPFCVLTVAAVPAIPNFLGWPAEFSGAIVPTTILAPHLTVVALDMMLGTALISLGMERKWLVVALVACVVSPALNLLTIPFTQATWGNGGIGAAASAILTETVMLAGALVLMPRGVLDGAILWLAARIVITAIPCVTITRWMLLNFDFPLPLALIPGTAIFVAGLFALRVVGLSEIRAVQRVGGQMVRTKLAR